jgi:hypothetical protein
MKPNINGATQQLRSLLHIIIMIIIPPPSSFQVTKEYNS